jgi:hypothetical protein
LVALLEAKATHAVDREVRSGLEQERFWILECFWMLETMQSEPRFLCDICGVFTILEPSSQKLE